MGQKARSLCSGKQKVRESAKANWVRELVANFRMCCRLTSPRTTLEWLSSHRKKWPHRFYSSKITAMPPQFSTRSRDKESKRSIIIAQKPIQSRARSITLETRITDEVKSLIACLDAAIPVFQPLTNKRISIFRSPHFSTRNKGKKTREAGSGHERRRIDESKRGCVSSNQNEIV